MGYVQLSRDERVEISVLKREGSNVSEIARKLGRSKSTISREVQRNWDRESYRAVRADEKAGWRRRKSRRNRHFTAEHMALVNSLLYKKHSPDQIAKTLRNEGTLSISHETIYQHVWRDKACGGRLYLQLRQRSKLRRKRYGSKDSRGKLAGKRMIDKRPKYVEARASIGHWEIDTVIGRSRSCLLTVVERKTGFVLISRLSARTTEEVNKSMVSLIRRHSTHMKTITSDNGTEFHGYKDVEAKTGIPFYFAHPYHSWERGTNENTNGLIRQYLPKGTSFSRLTQNRCDEIAREINERPRKRHQYKSPASLFLRVAL